MKSLKFIFKGYLKAFQVIEDAKLKKFYFLPGIISLVLFFIFYWVSTRISFSFYGYFEKVLKVQNYVSLAKILIKILVWIIGFLIYFLLYKSFTLIVLSPILGYVSEKTEVSYTGKEFQFTFKDNMRFIWRGIKVACRSLLVELLCLGIIVLMSFIPILNILTPLLLFVLQSYFTGASLVDYTLERKKYNSMESYRFLSKHFFFTTVNGIIFTLLLLIPVLGFFVAPLISTVGSTISMINLLGDGEKVPENTN